MTTDFSTPLRRLWDLGQGLWYSYGDLAAALRTRFPEPRFDPPLAAMLTGQLLKDVYRHHGLPNRARRDDGMPGDTDSTEYRAYRCLAGEMFVREGLPTWYETWPSWRRLSVEDLVEIMFGDR